MLINVDMKELNVEGGYNTVRQHALLLMGLAILNGQAWKIKMLPVAQ
jgi:hypothetical protein